MTDCDIVFGIRPVRITLLALADPARLFAFSRSSIKLGYPIIMAIFHLINISIVLFFVEIIFGCSHLRVSTILTSAGSDCEEGILISP